MANIKSAMKRIRTTEKRTLRNKAKKSELKTLIRKFDALLEEEKLDEAKELIKVIDRKLKRASVKNIIHKNAANKQLSKLTKKLTAAMKA